MLPTKKSLSLNLKYKRQATENLFAYRGYKEDGESLYNTSRGFLFPDRRNCGFEYHLWKMTCRIY